MGLFGRLFGGGGKVPAPEPLEYKGFRIIPQPMDEGGQYRLAALIEQGEGESLKTHHLIRADLIRDRDEAVEAAIAKAKQMIDQQGARLFG